MQEDMRMTLPARAPERGDWTIARGSLPGIGDVLRLSDGQEVINYRIPETATFDGVKEGLIVLFNRLCGVQTTDPAVQVAWQIKESIAVRHLLADVAAKVDVLFDRMVATSEPADAHMIRAVLVEHVDINAMGRAVWTIDLLRTGHGERPFHPGDRVIRSPDFRECFEVIDIELDNRNRHRIGLVVVPAPDLAFDLTPAPVIDDEPNEF